MMGFKLQKIALGTVQFGMVYGINNKRGQIPKSEVGQILRSFSEHGGALIDTAHGYGDSEVILGEMLAQEQLHLKVVSKFPKQGPERVEELLHETLAHLGLKSLYGYMLHDFKTYLDFPNVWIELQKLKERKLVQKIGFSLYHPDQAKLLLEQELDFDLVQVPYNVFDQRFSEVFAELKKRNVEVHVRSIFLQGLFFKQEETLSGHFADLKPKLSRLKNLSAEKNIPLHALLLNFAILNPYVDFVIVGVDSVQDLEMNQDVMVYQEDVIGLLENLKLFAETREELILPYLWK